MAKDFINNLNSELEKKPKESQVNSQAHSQDNIPIFSIPVNTTSKPNTKSFNVVMKSGLVKDLDKLAKRKGYSRNQLINYICQWCIDNSVEK